jgi:hypothetical protein
VPDINDDVDWLGAWEQFYLQNTGDNFIKGWDLNNTPDLFAEKTNMRTLPASSGGALHREHGFKTNTVCDAGPVPRFGVGTGIGRCCFAATV